MRGLFFTGTDTGVGKTFVVSAVVRAARRAGADVVGLKPIASGAVPTDKASISAALSPRGRGSVPWVSEDAAELFDASGGAEPLEVINPILLKAPRAPKVAAEMEGKIVDLPAAIASVRATAERHEAVAVEGVGGLLVPLSANAVAADFAAALGLPLLIVARAALGTINHTALTVNEARRRGLPVVGIVMNSPDGPDDEDLVRSNMAEIERMCGVRVLTALGYDPERNPARASDALARGADWKRLLAGGRT